MSAIRPQKAAPLSTEPILSSSAASQGTGGACAACGAPLAADQRYCLECGERRPLTSEFLRSGSPAAPASPPAAPPRPAPARGGEARPNSLLTLLAGVGVLLLAMGVGVLIGRAGSSGGKPAPAQVITVAAGGGGSGTSAAASEESFTGDWPSGTKGYTVQLQALPEGTTASAVEAAKTAASAKGASSVGALKDSEYSSLSGSGYLIYSGVYHKQAEAQKALGSLKSKFPGAKVVEVSSGGGSSGSESAGSAEATHAAAESKANLTKAAPSTALKSLGNAKGKNYEEKSKSLPNVVETK
jgi:hypothetical protein